MICDEDKELANQFGVKAVPTVLDSQHRLCNSDWLDGLSREEARVVCSERLQVNFLPEYDGMHSVCSPRRPGCSQKLTLCSTTNLP